MINVKRIDDKQTSVNGHRLSFDQSIDEYLIEDDRVIILLPVDDFEYGDPMVGRNILAYDSEGALLWRVEDPKITIGPEKTPQAFFDIERIRGKIRASAATMSYDLDPETGNLSNGQYHR